MGGQNALESLSELRVENRVNNRIERGIRIAQPREYLEGDVRDARLAEGRHDVDAEERHPADEEHAHDDAHGYGGFVVAHVIGRTMVLHVDVQRFVLLLYAPFFGCGRVLRDVDWSGDCTYVFHVFLGITV